jgi:hypothetical protein
MARLKNASHIYEVADLFQQRCLKTQTSLLWPDRKAWSPANITSLWDAYMGNLDKGDDSFLQKWSVQLANCSPDVHRVAADAFTFYLLFPSSIKPQNKLARLQEVLSWKLSKELPDLSLVNLAFSEGIGNPGIAYQNARPWQVAFILDYARRIHATGANASDPATARSLADAVLKDVTKTRTMRQVLLHLLFPDRYERVVNRGQKELIRKAYDHLSAGVEDLDDALFNIRKELSAQLKRPDLDFYNDDLTAQWWHDEETEDGAEQTSAVDLKAPSNPPAFTKAGFKLLESLSADPTKSRYSKIKDQLKEEIEEPFKKLMLEVGTLLPAKVTDALEIQSKVFSRFPKNDYGRGGCWDFFWGAFYPKGGKRVEDAQLYALIDDDHLEFGFSFADYGAVPKKTFLKNCRQHATALPPMLKDSLSDPSLLFGSAESSPPKKPGDWEAWLNNPPEVGAKVCRSMSRADVLSTSYSRLREDIAEVFAKLFPLFLLATKADPLGHIADYLDAGEEEQQIPPYSVKQCSTDTCIKESVISGWLASIERKGQAILYGPPGTGKTFVARKLAKVLAGGQDGLVDLIQFHPAYSYEDFIQGLRPVTNSNGDLSYDVMPGRLLDFCKRAKGKGTCVLILDEINRANLPKVLGELMYLLEYREEDIPLGGGGRFSIPKNVRIIGTMNTADRSIAMVDHALRRRFAFLPLFPNFEILRGFHSDSGFQVGKLISVLESLNAAIGNKNYQIGVSYFLRKDLAKHIEQIWATEIHPYIEEYFFDQPTKADEFAWGKVGVQLGL